MNIIIFIIGIVTIIASIGLYIAKAYIMEDKKTHFITYGAGIILGLAFIVFSNSFVIIPTGYTGIKKTFGQISSNTLPNGFNFKIPFVQTVEKINNKQQDIIFNDSEITSETSERNIVTFSGITVTYRINPEKSAWIAANISNYAENLVNESLVSSAIKTSSKTLSPVDVTNRSKLEPIAEQNIQESIDQKYGKDVVTINKVVINNASFDKEYDDKIAKKQQIENQKNIEKAEADAQVKRTTAQAEADATKIAAEAEAEANKKLADSLTQELIRNKLAEARLKHGWVTVNGSSTVVTDQTGNNNETENK